MNRGTSSLYVKALDFWTHISQYAAVSPLHNNLKLEALQRVSSIFQLGEMYYFIFDIKQVRFDFISPSITQILGFPTSITVQEFLDRIHPEDQSYFLVFEELFSEFLLNLPADHIPQYKSRYDFRIKNHKNQYVRILHQLMVIQQDKDGFPLRSLAVHTDITHLKPSGKPKLSFIGNGDFTSHFNVESKKINNHNKLLTKREHEILRLIANGKTSPVIAESLNISRHTVDSHRKNILKKTTSKNTQELIKKSIIEGWI